MSILVNRIPTSEFQIHKGLKKGDPLALFLFIIIVEGLTGLLNKVVECGIL